MKYLVDFFYRRILGSHLESREETPIASGWRVNRCWRPQSCLEHTVSSPFQKLDRVSLPGLRFCFLVWRSPSFILELFLSFLFCSWASLALWPDSLGRSGCFYGLHCYLAFGLSLEQAVSTKEFTFLPFGQDSEQPLLKWDWLQVARAVLDCLEKSLWKWDLSYLNIFRTSFLKALRLKFCLYKLQSLFMCLFN